MNSETIFKTTDLFEAAYLYASRQKFLGLESQDNRRYWFLFANAPECERLINSYWEREAVMCIRDYVDALKAMKDKVFQKKSSNVNIRTGDEHANYGKRTI